MDQWPGEPSLPDRSDTGVSSFDGAAAGHLEATLSFQRDLARSTGGAPIELFRRSSWRRRVTLKSNGASLAHQSGSEHGVAVRIASSANSYSFASSSGSTVAAARAAAQLAQSCPATATSTDPFWASGSGQPLMDVADEGAFPTLAELERWARVAVGSGVPKRRDGISLDVWVETAVTIESLVATGGLAACRQRGRAWATFRMGGETRTLAGRSLDALDPLALVPRTRMERDIREIGAIANATIQFEPDPAAALVAAVVAVIHGPGGAQGSPVGGGWRIEDHPMDPAGLIGGAFDDAGFATRRTLLADGNSIRGLLEGAGHEVRGSYREPPGARFTNLLVEPQATGNARIDLAVDWLRLHPLDEDRWLAEFRGTDPRTADPVRGVIRAGNAQRLVRQCTGSHGEPQRTALGVTTPSLIFEGLALV